MRSKEEYMELLRSYFQNKAKAYGVVKMALFGSVVRGEQTETSDVDVAYEGKADILLRCRMKQELALSGDRPMRQAMPIHSSVLRRV